mmetsp:Transcript_102686/g.203871  ORF Transcript_102686/g.203871 Transcript_102686/m.203871 type:complete len:96 (+) Transcript_102686:87-374(+)
MVRLLKVALALPFLTTFGPCTMQSNLECCAQHPKTVAVASEEADIYDGMSLLQTDVVLHTNRGKKKQQPTQKAESKNASSQPVSISSELDDVVSF